MFYTIALAVAIVPLQCDMLEEGGTSCGRTDVAGARK